MLIINADDLGRNASATDNTLLCHARGRISSASAMVHMEDSRRAAESANDAGLETGLHINLDLPLNGPDVPAPLRERQRGTAEHFRGGKSWPQFVYNPFLRKDFDYVFKAQHEEFRRLFGKDPAHFDGHHHRHLCANMLIDRIVPPGSRIRRNFSFERGEKSVLNRAYRRLVDGWLVRRYCCADGFYALDPIADFARLARILSRARREDVELMAHPESPAHCAFLLGDRFGEIISGVRLGSYRMLSRPGLS